MLALSLKLLLPVITFCSLSSLYSSCSPAMRRSKTRRPTFDYINPSLSFCCDLDGAFSDCVSLYYWFIVARYIGLYRSLSPNWRPRGTNSSRLRSFDPPITKPRKPPDKYRRGCFAMLFFYLLVVFINTNAVYRESMPLSSLSAVPLTFFSSFFFSAMHQRENQRAIKQLFSPTISPIQLSSTDPFIFESNDSSPSNATKLAMLCAWQTSNSRTPIYMDYAPGSKAICVDTGASSCISNDRKDFITLEKVNNQTISGIGSGLTIEGHGTLRWTINDDDGNAIILHVRNALYVPNVPMCLLCPQQIAKQTGKANDGFHAEATHGTLTYDSYIRTIPYNSRNGLPIVFTSGNMRAMFSPFQTESSSPHAPCASIYAAALLSTEIDSPTRTVDNITRTQRLLLLVHESMAHLHLNEVQRLARSGYFGDSLRCIGSCDKPLCHACCTGKAVQRSVPSDGTPIKTDHLKPGDCISTDQLESNSPGRVAVWKGQPSKRFYHACTFFTDHASNKVHITLNYSTGAEEAVTSKHRFEKMASENGVLIKKYRGDNGVYATYLFKSSCEVLNQAQDFSGVGAKHQNGVAERMIGTITRRARTMLLHATILWPEIITEDLWPFALKMAVDVHNATPNSSGLSPDESFSGHKTTRCRLKDFHPFGCPVFVLEASLQNGHKIPKWKPRSRMGVYLGHSPDHATTVPLVLNTTTGLVSPQFHMVFDDCFTTTKSLQTDQLPKNWPALFKHSEVNLLDSDQEQHHKLDASWHPPSDPPTSSPSKSFSQVRFVDELERLASEEAPSTDISPVLSPDPILDTSTEEREIVSSISTSSSHIDGELQASTLPQIPSLRLRKGNLLAPKTPVAREAWNPNHQYSTRFKKTMTANVAALETTLENEIHHFSLNGLCALMAEQDAIHSNNDGTSNILHPFAFAAANDDTLHYGQMRKDPDRDKFEIDMQREVSDLLSSNSVKIVDRASIPKTSKPVPAIWSFRRKRAPDWTITKWKSRLCPHGGKQIEGIDFWETYAPVVTWSTVRLILVLSLLTGMKSRQIDYILAYTQAPIDCEIYMCIPAQFIVEDGTLKFSSVPTPGNSDVYVLLLTKNLYGLRQAGNNWFDKLRDSLLARGFRQSSIDPCLFVRKDLILVVYVDDCLIFARADTTLDDFVTSLRSDFNLTCEGDVGAFLGIQFTRTSTGQMQMTQPGLISKIIKECGLDSESKRHDTPAVTKLLQKDSSGPQREHQWSYRTLIGMLTYLSMSSRPDIAFAVHQCARYSTCPMRIHEIAVRRICRYLQATTDKGYILHPRNTLRNLDCYVDADFAGMWNEEITDEPSSVKSRTGYVILFANCPVLWVSKLQTEIALSTTEAEYIALSQAMRDLIPMRTLLTELATLTNFTFGDTITHSTVFEDNKGCVELANAPKMRPRTKHIAIKYHHFRSHVARGDIKIQWIDTKHQLADIFTKPLAEPLFASLRLLLLGW